MFVLCTVSILRRPTLKEKTHEKCAKNTGITCATCGDVSICDRIFFTCHHLLFLHAIPWVSHRIYIGFTQIFVPKIL